MNENSSKLKDSFYLFRVPEGTISSKVVLIFSGCDSISGGGAVWISALEWGSRGRGFESRPPDFVGECIRIPPFRGDEFLILVNDILYALYPKYDSVVRDVSIGNRD